MKQKKVQYNFKLTTQLTGINSNTLRAWERRYPSLSPQKNPNGRRTYGSSEVEKLKRLWSLVQCGHLIGNIAELDMKELTKLQEDHHQIEAPDSRSRTQEIAPEETPHLKNILHSLKKFDLAEIQYHLQIARFELSPKSIVHNLTLPLMREVGQLVAKSELDISQEHLISSLLRDHLGQLFQSLNPYEHHSRKNTTKVLFTTREGDLHEFGILLAAILCRIAGHETYYLGPNMPVEDLAKACRKLKISVLVLGLAEIPKDRELISAGQFLQRLDQEIPHKIQILCGGRSQMPQKSLNSKRTLIHFQTLHELDRYFNGATSSEFAPSTGS